jgi:hypothetical protein
VKRGATPEFVNMSKEILYPQIQGVTLVEMIMYLGKQVINLLQFIML